jgi:site-specific recombinase XerD
VSLRKGKPNTFHVDFPRDLVPDLEEFLAQVRPKFPCAAEQPYVFLTKGGKPHTRDSLYGQITTHIYIRSGGKRVFPHALRTFFFSEGVAAGKDINFLSAVMNIDPVVALRNYHELKAAETLKALDEFNRLTLT